MSKKRSFHIPGAALLFLIILLAIIGPPDGEGEEASPLQFLQGERHLILASLEQAAGDDREALMLIEYHRPHLINGRHLYGYALNAEGELLNTRSDRAPDGCLQIYPSTHQERLRAGTSPSGINFVHSQGYRGISIVEVPPLDQFTRLWFGVRTLHELRHAYDLMSGLEPDPGQSDGQEVTRAFAEGEVRAHTLETRLIDQAVDGAFMRLVREIAERTIIPRGFPETHTTIFPNSHNEFPELERLFDQERSQNERNSRWGAFNIACYFALCDRMGGTPDCRLRFMQAYINQRPQSYN